jgi:hypothetical protein
MEWWRDQFVALMLMAAGALGGGCLFRPIMVPSGPDGEGGYGPLGSPERASANAADAGAAAPTADQSGNNGAGGAATGSGSSGEGRDTSADGNSTGFVAPGAAKRPCGVQDLFVVGARVVCNGLLLLPDGTLCDLTAILRGVGNRDAGVGPDRGTDAGIEDGSAGSDAADGSDGPNGPDGSGGSGGSG